MTGLDRTPIVVLADEAKNPLRGAVPPSFELPPSTPSSDSLADTSDPRSPATAGPRTPLVTSTPTTIPLTAKKDPSQPSCILADRMRGEALAALRDQQQNQVSMITAPSAEARDGHNDSSLLI